MKEQVFTVKIKSENTIVVYDILDCLRKCDAIDDDGMIEVVTPAEPTAAELLQAWKDGCRITCSDGISNNFPCKCLCDKPKDSWNIPEIIKAFKESQKTK